MLLDLYLNLEYKKNVIETGYCIWIGNKLLNNYNIVTKLFFVFLPSLVLLTLLVAVTFVHRVLQESYHFISRVLIEERGPFNTSSPDSTVLLESRIFVVYLIRF